MNQANKINATILFADVCRSTFLFSELGDEAAAALIERILGVTGEAVLAHGGRVLRSQGDDVLCLFGTAEDAMDAALEIHRSTGKLAPEGGPDAEMRIGANSGPVLISGSEIAGDTVNVAARLCQMAKGGQTLVSESTRGELGDRSPGPLRDLGLVHLKGKPLAIPLFELLDNEQLDEITHVGPATGSSPVSNRLSLHCRGQRFELDFTLVRFLLGREGDCDLVMDNPLVSRHHAEIRFRGKGFVLRDFSTNGTLVLRDGRRRPVHQGEVALRGRGSLFLGRTDYNREFEIAYHASGGHR